MKPGITQSSSNPVQLPLGVTLQDSYTFDNFLGADNGLVINSLLDMLQQPGFQFAWLWGAEFTGKTHLLQASCVEMSKQGGAVAFIPCEQFAQSGHEILQGLETCELVCLDNIQVLAGKPEWEQVLFALFNALRDSQSSLIVSAPDNLAECEFQLPDLVSRFQWGLNFRLLSLNDEQKVQALLLRCQSRGILVKSEVLNWLIKHVARDMGSLYACMDQLIGHAIEQQRQMTIPFIKSVYPQASDPCG